MLFVLVMDSFVETYSAPFAIFCDSASNINKSWPLSPLVSLHQELAVVSFPDTASGLNGVVDVWPSHCAVRLDGVRRCRSARSSGIEA